MALTRDERGWFETVYSGEEVVEVCRSCSARAGTLRGLHYQLPPRAQTKIVKCLRGMIFDVVLDLRTGDWRHCTLTPHIPAITVPAGCAHGFLTLDDDVEILYLLSDHYAPELARGVRWDDPAFGIEWPWGPTVISERDATWPNWKA